MPKVGGGRTGHFDAKEGQMTKETRKLRAVGYIRVSDESQVEGHSLDAQRNEIARWCESHGYQLVCIYSDQGVSAHTDRINHRPQLVELLRDAENGLFDLVVVHTLDRWARNVGVQRQALQVLGDARVGFASVTEGIDFTTPSGRLLLTTIGGVAEFFSDQLGVHVSKAQRRKADLGLPVGPVPFGYVISEPGGVPEVDKREAEAIREVFERRAAGESNESIARWLNAGFRTRNKRMFTGHSIKDMVKSRFYLGEIPYRGEAHLGKHAAIVPEELFLRVQARRWPRTVIRKVLGPKGLF